VALSGGFPEWRERERLRDLWAARCGLRPSSARTDPIPWLLGRRSPCYSAPAQWFDHGTRWVKDGRPACLVGQPYQLHVDDLRELADLEQLGLQVTVATSPAWHYPGSVLGVVVWAEAGEH